ncbi:proline-rich transmembrane protein 1-like isoform X2 [Dreissena polymorpha]|uniref:Uncharacterized protein n=1 Tax=Dreissena polymorpha TaxID=45954 RepID=A0A9D4HD89_DREPO|nr:proline-rich transmembrane protein 1-like isoform X1 [Dreissena polymorpha]XP_052276789.1 proline-rich transmembrane protein 1-like isoform X2 [Dreissena polymorpha]KAH3831224.1 hypothetical protein DPMN_104486 [Dreissena polymorpha]
MDNKGYPQPPQAGYPGPPPPVYPQPPPGYGQQYGYPPPQQNFSAMSSNQTVVVTNQPTGGTFAVVARPPDYMVPSVLACLFCFWPTGLFAIYFALQANTAVARGDMGNASRYSALARNLMISSIVVGVAWITLVIVLEVAVVARTCANINGYC